MEKSLQAQIDAAPTALIADCKRAELAAYRARIGRFGEASRSILSLRQSNLDYPRLELSIWINLAEGLLAYFQGGGVTKSDGVQRAYALSVAAGLEQERAICAAWLAQWEYTTVNIASLAKYVRESLRLASDENHSARARASLVCAQALHLAGRIDLAHVWYRRTKEHALISHDEATIGALMHNMAWQRMLMMRQLILTGRGNADAAQHALSNAESTFRFDELVGDTSWEELKPLLRAQIISLQGEPDLALEIYNEKLLGSNLGERWQSSLLADQAWCCAALGQRESALRCAEMAVSSLIGETQIDDRAATHSRLAAVFGALELKDKENYHQSEAVLLWEKFSLVQNTVVHLLANIDAYGA
jgi:tetratricopeptide (TPR) repeat protein